MTVNMQLQRIAQSDLDMSHQWQIYISMWFQKSEEANDYVKSEEANYHVTSEEANDHMTSEANDHVTSEDENDQV